VNWPAADRPQYFYADQYSNPANWRAHYRDHGQRNTRADRRPDHPLRRRPRHHRHLHGHHAPPEGSEPEDRVHLHAARLALPRPRRPEAHGHGDCSGHLRSQTRRPQHPEVETEAAYAMAKRLARTEGLLVGVSAAAAVAASLRIAEEQARSRKRSSHCYDSAIPPTNTSASGSGRSDVLRLSLQDYDAMREHGEQTYPHECCGVLLGRFTSESGRLRERSRGRRIVRAGNTRTDSAHNRYHIAPGGAGQDPAHRPRARPRHRRLLPLPSRPPGPVVAHRLRRSALDRLQLTSLPRVDKAQRDGKPIRSC
jgi:hypothetical protein